MTRKNPKNCPICGKPPSPEHGPFCSIRCKDRDLAAWLNEGYRIPVREQDDEDA
jgi:endogenous inhibitor of DNA gyrase (YacG/DUF329 family)